VALDLLAHTLLPLRETGILWLWRGDEFIYFEKKTYVLVEYGYSAINILKEHNVTVLCIPSYDLFKPWKWVLLFHELGHTLFDIEREAFIKEFRRRIMPLLKQLAPTSFNREHAVLRIWEQYWLGEFVSDLYGVSLGGPAYTYAFMIEVFNSNPSGYRETHPSLDSRVYL